VTIAVASGKGGTGKTTLAVNLAYVLARRNAVERSAQPGSSPDAATHPPQYAPGRPATHRTVCLLDCDVEEPNTHLFFLPVLTTTTDVTVFHPRIDPAQCTACGKCVAECNFNALTLVHGEVGLIGELCHACGVCARVCPEDAIVEDQAPIGVVDTAHHGSLTIVRGVANVASSLAPRVVAAVREYEDPDALNIIDCPPGATCQVVASIEGVDVALLVTEPTPFGLHDLRLAVELTAKLEVPTAIVVNRSDGKNAGIIEFAEQVGVPVIGLIPFRREYAAACSSGELLVEQFDDVTRLIEEIVDRLPTAVVPSRAGDGSNGGIPLDGRRPEASHGPLPAVFEPRVGAPEGDSFEIVVLSGKGGTGKTTIAACLAELTTLAAIADTDVDAPDLHLLLNPAVVESHPFAGSPVARIDPGRCTSCCLCVEACHFGAIGSDVPAGADGGGGGSPIRVRGSMCEGCGLCVRVCPEGAVALTERISGTWYLSTTSRGPMAHALLGIGEENSGRLVTRVRQAASGAAPRFRATPGAPRNLILSDGPPGTGCPATASVTGADMALMVAEPTVSGVHDLERALRLTTHFVVPTAIAINRCDINEEQAGRIAELADRYSAPVVGRIPFDQAVGEALRQGRTVVGAGDSPAADAIRQMWKMVQAHIRSVRIGRVAPPRR
jgi:MinD superfamily P-loop ATPase